MNDHLRDKANLQRQVFRKTVYRLWQMAQAGLLEEMTDVEYRIATILLDHPEYEDIFDDETLRWWGF
jgi:hypothetical protein